MLGIPGVPKDIHVAVDGNIVTLRAEVKQQDSSNQDEKLLRSGATTVPCRAAPAADGH